MNLVCQHECNEKAQKRNSVNASQATMEQPSRTIVHAKLEMTNPDSQEEVEADAVANEIVQGGKIARSILSGSSDGGMAVSSQMEGRLNSMQGGGQVMPDGLRNMMERGFNRDFSQVRLHTDSEAASLSSSIHAKAFTHGNDIYFNQGQFSPNTSDGQRLMAHELTHVAQGGEKVGRIPLLTDVIPKEIFHSAFVTEQDYVETPETKKIISDNYIPVQKNDRKPLTIVLYTSSQAGDNAFFQDTGINHLVQNETQSKVLIIQGKTSLEEYMAGIKFMVNLYGPLQNLILMGHGYIDSMELDGNVIISTSSDSFFDLIKKEFERADKETSQKLTHSILFSECLTGANKHSPNGLVNHVKCMMPDAYVRGNLAETRDGQTYGHMDLDNKESTPDAPLTWLDNNDESTPVTGVCETSVNEGQRERYSGPNVSGFLFDVYNYLSFPGSNQIVPNLETTRKIDSYCPISRVYSGTDIVGIIREHISSDPKATLSFVNYMLFFPVVFENIQTYESMFEYAKNNSYMEDIIY